MPKILYVKWKPNKKSQELLDHINKILAEYKAAGYSLSVRQLYYQMVTANLVVNHIKSYNMIASIIKKGREAGFIDWNHIQDRGRFVRENRKWNDPSDALRELAHVYTHDIWQDQKWRIEVWVEKDALVEVVGKISREYDVPYVSCRGFPSATAIWEAAHSRMLRFHGFKHSDPQAKIPQPRFLIIHLSDHDPSGIAMTKDLRYRMEMFSTPYGNLPRPAIHVERLGLTLEQVEKFNCPPNPAKESDPRFKEYQERFGDESWELDALNPKVIEDLIRAKIESFADMQKLEAQIEHRDLIREKFVDLSLKVGRNEW
jgi:hypothetical protein